MKCARLASLLLPLSVVAQSLDWSDGVVVFGTDGEETRPALCITPDGAQLRSFCVRDDASVSDRTSQTDGMTWGVFADASPVEWGTRVECCADGDAAYALVYAPMDDRRWLQRFDSTAVLWDDNLRLEVSPNPANPTLSAAMVTDVRYAPGEPFLHLAWLEWYPSSGDISAHFCQSRDQGESLTAATEVFRVSDSSPIENEVSLAVNWIGEEERIWLAASVDRPGSVAEGIQVFSSVDQGETWSAGRQLDSSAYPQVNPSIAGHEQTLLLAYSRRIDAFTQKDVHFVFSLDGGEQWTEPAQLTNGVEDEFAPQVVISPELETFAVFYLSAPVAGEDAVLHVRTGLVATPWELSEPVAVSGSRTVSRSGGFSACGDAGGFAVAWAGPGILGDADVFFNAGWLNESTERACPVSAADFTLRKAFPNPFNNSVTIEFAAGRSSPLSLHVFDLLGRRLRTVQLDGITPGVNRVRMDLSALPSGAYVVQSDRGKGPGLRLHHVK